MTGGASSISCAHFGVVDTQFWNEICVLFVQFSELLCLQNAYKNYTVPLFTSMPFVNCKEGRKAFCLYEVIEADNCHIHKYLCCMMILY